MFVRPAQPWYAARSVPTILYEQGFRFSFFAADGVEPPHIHVRGSSGAGKWWLDPVRLASARGFTTAERRRIEAIIHAHHRYLLQRWNDFFSAAE